MLSVSYAVVVFSRFGQTGNGNCGWGGPTPALRYYAVLFSLFFEAGRMCERLACTGWTGGKNIWNPLLVMCTWSEIPFVVTEDLQSQWYNADLIWVSSIKLENTNLTNPLLLNSIILKQVILNLNPLNSLAHSLTIGRLNFLFFLQHFHMLLVIFLYG